ncbi:MAG: hypothetical protein A2087_13660 [Spirochaetes bacterium GWD1_61_31]|nr:MAG: hypothetical protein A2Y37_14370 [Spirochaetes bacterium GWB1_60_80]OHD28537.1 MAG: hypothetical protein A2004_02730 [Spirochaetes bacterium GWC1_61_12]OHD42201.1 MAG: hypothetical protein A2087_13660 [Spirochaetes bacterium GWD1_61_31]OHD44531.1 MAG: hypothetical protein A2Y35_05210 [Spirochaetes bacterium GWE1_60_18]OHD59317.1 MAG: hypothetical protein A2Y32_08285 [Spirochaetes bacterium GWF1_60_12]HAP43186.1 hypothetical protein [Spirochaetaceae bacterium]
MTTDACYTVLGLNRDAPSAEIRKAYRNLSLKLHPDASGSPATAGGFSRVQRAYKILTARKIGDRAPARPTRLPSLPAAALGDVFSLGGLLVSHRDAATRAEAAKQLGLSGKRSVWVFLRRGLYDADERVRCSCVRAAAVLGLAQGGAEIASAWQACSLACRKAMLRIAEATVASILLPALKAALRAEEPELRLQAIRIMREYQDQPSS